eukprot:scaffold75924_cov63-Phaeocystis_antarctica.AAC.3
MAAQTGDEYSELLAEGARYASQQDARRAARAFREAIALRPDKPTAYLNLGAALFISAMHVEAAQRYLQGRLRLPVGSKYWAMATAEAFDLLQLPECAEVAKPEWWNGEELKALSARVVRAAPENQLAINMRAMVLGGLSAGSWEAGPRSVAELSEAATLFDRAAALHPAPVAKANLAGYAERCRRRAEAM